MPQSKNLVDTNSYLRLAQTIRPLLFSPFGDDEYCLYILPELNEELGNRRLNSKFPWVDEAEYAENRKCFPTIARKQKKSIQDTFDYVWDHVQTSLPGPSKVDALYIAYAIELDIPVVTDDQDMVELAKAFGAKSIPTLKLMRIMYDNDHADLTKIKGIVDYWKAIGDCPANLHSDLKTLFPEL